MGWPLEEPTWGQMTPLCPFYFSHKLETNPSNSVINFGERILHKYVRIGTVRAHRAEGTGKLMEQQACLCSESSAYELKGLPSQAGGGVFSGDKVSWVGGKGRHASPKGAPSVLVVGFWAWQPSAHGPGALMWRHCSGSYPVSGVVLFCLSM